MNAPAPYFDPSADADLVARSLISEAAEHGVTLVRVDERRRGPDEVPPTESYPAVDLAGEDRYAESIEVDAVDRSGETVRVRHCGPTLALDAAWRGPTGDEVDVAYWIDRGPGS